MRVQYPLSDAKRVRILAKAERAMARRMAAKKKTDKERTSRWWAIWVTALGIRQFGGANAED